MGLVPAAEMDEMRLQIREQNRLYREEFEKAKQEGRLDAENSEEDEKTAEGQSGHTA